MARSAKQVVRLSPAAQAIVAARAAKREISLSQATDELVLYAHNRLEALRKNNEKRATAKEAKAAE